MFNIVAEAKEYLCWFLSSSTDKPSDVFSKYNLKFWDDLTHLCDTHYKSAMHSTHSEIFFKVSISLYTCLWGQ